MARDVLSVLILTVALENAFSQARWQIKDTHYLLDSHALKVLVCFKDFRLKRQNQGRKDVDNPKDKEI